MTPVTDNNMGTRKGWKRGRYGRAIAVMRLKKNDGTKVNFSNYVFSYTNTLSSLSLNPLIIKTTWRNYTILVYA